MMQVTDAMVAAAIEAWRRDWLTGPPEQNETSAMRAALEAALAEMWRPIAPSDQYVTDIYTHLKGRIPMHIIDDVLRAASAVPRGK